MPNEELRRSAYDKIANLVQALGSPARLRIVQILAQAPRSVEAIAALVGESVANTSQHLQKLKKEGLVAVTRQGIRRDYRLSDSRVLLLWETFQDLAQTLSPELHEVEQALSDPSLLSGEDLPAVLALVERKRATLLDIRPAEEASATPIDDAKTIPLAELTRRRNELSKKLPVYVFCRGRFCSLATQAVTDLRKAGFRAQRLRESPYLIRQTKESIA